MTWSTRHHQSGQMPFPDANKLICNQVLIYLMTLTKVEGISTNFLYERIFMLTVKINWKITFWKWISLSSSASPARRAELSDSRFMDRGASVLVARVNAQAEWNMYILLDNPVKSNRVKAMESHYLIVAKVTTKCRVGTPRMLFSFADTVVPSYGNEQPEESAPGQSPAQVPLPANQCGECDETTTRPGTAGGTSGLGGSAYH